MFCANIINENNVVNVDTYSLDIYILNVKK